MVFLMLLATASAPVVPPSFATCTTCHATSATAPRGMGPDLFRVVGRKAGSHAGFSYSPAMKSFGKIWNAALLDRFLAAPQVVVPGTSMPYPGEKDAAKRAEIIQFLKKLH